MAENICGNKGSCCKRCKHIVFCEDERVIYTALCHCVCDGFEDDGSNICDSCDLNPNRKDGA